MEDNMKCRKCGETKPLTDFPRNKHVTKGDHPGIDPMCKACWKKGRQDRQGVVAGAKEAGVAVPKRTTKKTAKVAEGSESAGAEEAPASPQTDGEVVDPASVVPTVTTEIVDGTPIDIIHNPTRPDLDKNTWYKGLIGPLADVVKFFKDVFGRDPEKVFKYKSTWYFPLTDDESKQSRKL